MNVIRAAAVLLLIFATVQLTPAKRIYKTFAPAYGYKCKTGRCIRTRLTEENQNNLEALSVCKQQCAGHGNLWPKPRGLMEIGKQLAPLHVWSIYSTGKRFNPRVLTTLSDAFNLFSTQQLNKAIKYLEDDAIYELTANRLVVQFDLATVKTTGLELNPDESYELQIGSVGIRTIQANITANNFYGARHALETLNQLIIVDDIREQIRIPDSVHIKDSPAYPYRGVLIDTSRTFITIEALKKTIDAMGASKLNSLHWHITDTHSFPFESRSFPQLTKFGAYSDKHVYTESEIKDLVHYAQVRGVRIIPELDAPAHIGSGWHEFAPETVLCFDANPWKVLCMEPPCGQVDPTKEKVYEILEGLYKDMLRSFEPTVFHMGGDEVKFNCWNNSQDIQHWLNERKLNNESADSFHELWNHFQTKALQKLELANGGKSLPVILWTSSLTGDAVAEKYLDPQKYVIQVWTAGNNGVIAELARKKYRLIFSNVDALYLDCGYGAWYGTGNNWCSPYIGWQKIYDNDPRTLLKNSGVTDEQSLKLALGAEAALWTEQAGSDSMGTKIWPRAAAMAERLWTNPPSDWLAAESRFLEHFTRLADLGVQPDSVEPQWCQLNEGYCNN